MCELCLLACVFVRNRGGGFRFLWNGNKKKKKKKNVPRPGEGIVATSLARLRLGHALALDFVPCMWPNHKKLKVFFLKKNKRVREVWEKGK